MGLQSQCATMKVLLVCLGLLVVVSLGRGEALADNHEELSLKTLEASEVKDQAADISSIRNAREAKRDNDGPKKGRGKTKKGKDRKSRKQKKHKKKSTIKKRRNKKNKNRLKKRRNKNRKG